MKLEDMVLRAYPYGLLLFGSLHYFVHKPEYEFASIILALGLILLQVNEIRYKDETTNKKA